MTNPASQEVVCGTDLQANTASLKVYVEEPLRQDTGQEVTGYGARNVENSLQQRQRASDLSDVSSVPGL